jgi:hypothetical protein
MFHNTFFSTKFLHLKNILVFCAQTTYVKFVTVLLCLGVRYIIKILLPDVLWPDLLCPDV